MQFLCLQLQFFRRTSYYWRLFRRFRQLPFGRLNTRGTALSLGWLRRGGVFRRLWSSAYFCAQDFALFYLLLELGFGLLQSVYLASLLSITLQPLASLLNSIRKVFAFQTKTLPLRNGTSPSLTLFFKLL